MNTWKLCALLTMLAWPLGSLAAADAPQCARPDRVLTMLQSQDASGELAGWRSFLEAPGAKTGEVWQLADGVLKCKGAPKGYLYTENDFTNFVLELQWRWAPGTKPGSGGVLVRMTGPHQIWPKSLEPQINAGDAGDLWGLAGYELTGPADRTKVVEHPKFGKLTNVKKTQNAENPPGQWNDYRIEMLGPNITLTINGKVVNRAGGCAVAPGRICLTAEGDAIEFRNVRIRPCE